MLMKTFLSPLLTMVCLYGGLRYQDGFRVRWLVVSGASIGMACLSRENHILLLLPLLIWVGTVRGSTQLPRWRRALHMVCLLAASGLMILPATLRNWAVSGDRVLVTSGGGESFYTGNGPYATGAYNRPPFVVPQAGREHEDFRSEARRRTGQEFSRSASSRFWFRAGLQEIASRPGRWLRLMSVKLHYLFHDLELPDNQSYSLTREYLPLLYVLPSFGWVVGLGLVGAVLCLSELRRYQLPLGLALAHMLGVLLIFVSGRYRLGMVPLWILLAAFAVTWGEKRGERS